MSGPRRRRLGLRARVTVAFGLGALALSVTLAALSYGITRTYLVRQRDESALRQAALNAQVLRRALRTPNPDVPQVLGTLVRAEGSTPVLYHRGVWFATSLAIGRDALPADLREIVVAGQPARQRFRYRGTPRLAVGLPVPAVEAAYFEVFPLSELDRTLRTLGTSVSAAAAVTTLLGSALGRWAAGRSLQPLRLAARAASAIEGGRLDTRLDARDPDLGLLAGAFNQMADALQRRIERDTRFASDVSHELRSPLTTLLASVDVLAVRREELSPAGRQALDLLGAELRRFAGMVEDLLEISRADAGAADLALEDVRLGELVRHALDRAHDGTVPLEVQAGVAGAVVRADKRRMERVIANLVQNADTHGGGVVRVEVARAGRRLRVAVEDAGPGVPPDQRQRVFERFSRGGGSGSRGSGGGVGLGLALVAEHVRLHGGEVWVEDRSGGGARVVVELPEAVQ